MSSESGNNKIMDEIKKKGNDFFQKNLALLETNKDNNDIKSFLSLMFSDILSIEKMSDQELNELFELIKDPKLLENYFNKYNEKVMRFNNRSNIYTEQIKLKVKNKVKTLLKKIIECNQHIDIIKKYYIDLVISERLDPNSVGDLVLKNKTVLYQSDKKERYKIAELMTRYLISIIATEQSVPPKSNEYYNLDNIYSSFIEDIEGKKSIKEYSKWSPQIKYFIVQLMIIEVLFEANTEFKKLFNQTNLKKNIDELLKPDAKKEGKKKNKDKEKKKKQKGGFEFINSNIKNKMRQVEIGKKTKNNKGKNKSKNSNKKNGQSQEKKNYIEILKNTEVDDTTLNSIFYLNFKSKLGPFFINIARTICDETRNGKLPMSQTIDNPFYKSEKLTLKDYFANASKNKNSPYLCGDIDVKFKEFKFEIFNSLIVFKNSNNFSILYDFIKKVRFWITLLLFSLYNIKKKIYNAYIISAQNVFSFDLTELEKEAEKNKKENNAKNNKSNKENNKVEKQQQNNQGKKGQQQGKQNNKGKQKEKNFGKQNQKNKNNQASIANIKNKLEKLDEEYKNINDDKKKLKLQKMYHKMIVEKLAVQ